MKKYNIFVHVVSNCVLVALLFGLYIACVPIDNAVKTGAPIYKGDPASGKIALMFNVYENSDCVEEILDICDKYGAVCTFFVGGCWAEKNIDLLIRMSERAELGNHGYLHSDHAKLSVKQNREEIMLCHNLVNKVTGIEMRLFAPPSGSIGANMTAVCEEEGYKVIMWTKDTIDWRDHDSNLVYKRATEGIESGDMILLHPYPHTVKALPSILEAYKKAGFSTATVTEIISGLNEKF